MIFYINKLPALGCCNLFTPVNNNTTAIPSLQHQQLCNYRMHQTRTWETGYQMVLLERLEGDRRGEAEEDNTSNT